MTNDQNKNNGMGGAVTAGIAGAALGAAAVLLSNKDNRDKIKEKFNDVKQTGEDKLNMAKTKLEEVGQQGREKVSEALGQAQEKMEGIENKAKQQVTKAKIKVNEI